MDHTAVLELLGRCNADLAFRMITADLVVVVVVVLLCIALILTLLLTSLALILLPLRRPVVASRAPG